LIYVLITTLVKKLILNQLFSKNKLYYFGCKR